jgi:hypothetical protein
MQLGGHRGIYNSAWVGSLVALLTSVFLSLFGFYLVKNAVEADRRSGVGVVLAATPVSRWAYVLGKTLSNLAVLATMVALLLVGAAAMQWVRGEDTRIDPAALTAPFLFITLPAMAFVAALAVLFEVVPGLRGGAGNVVWFVVWSFGMAQGALRRTAFDVLGMGRLAPNMAEACRRAFPDYDAVRMPMSVGLNFKSSGAWDLTTFRWEGLPWSAQVVAERMVWPALALGLCGIAAVVFDRFDAAPARARPRRRSARETAGEVAVAPPRIEDVRLSPLREAPRFGIAPLVGAELRLMRRSVPLFGALVAVGLLVASLLAPLPAVRRGILPALWILPLFLWSPLGNRDVVHGVADLLRSSPRPLVRPLMAQWVAGAALALVLGAGAAVRFALSGDAVGSLGVLVGAAFVSSLAVALGTVSRSAKAFEVAYLLLWYVGPVNRAPGLDFTGGQTSIAQVTIWAVMAAALLAAALAARRRA